MLKKYSILLFFILIATSLAFAEEIVLTTYYPSPYGNYNNLTAANLTATNNVTLATQTGSSISIGTTNTNVKLEVSGGHTYLQTMSVGNSGGQYQEIGYNVGFTGIANSYVYRISDTAASIRLGNGGGIEFRTAPSGTSGNALTLTNRMQISQAGLVGIGRTPTTNKLEVEGEASKTTAGAFIANSDKRIKTAIGNINNAVDTLSLLHPVKFKYTDEYRTQHPAIRDRYYYNFIAQEFQQIFPDDVTLTNDTLPSGERILALDSSVVIPYLVKAIQEIKNENEALKERVKALETKK